MEERFIRFIIVLNLWFVLSWLNQPSFKQGVLIRDITVPLTQDVKIILPKGLVVKDESPRGLTAIGQFDKNRFSITITSDFKMVNYDVNWEAMRRPISLYPAIDQKFMPPRNRILKIIPWMVGQGEKEA